MLSKTKVIYIFGWPSRTDFVSGKCTSHDPEEAVYKSRTHWAFFSRPDGEVLADGGLGGRLMKERQRCFKFGSVLLVVCLVTTGAYIGERETKRTAPGPVPNKEPTARLKFILNSLWQPSSHQSPSLQRQRVAHILTIRAPLQPTRAG